MVEAVPFHWESKSQTLFSTPLITRNSRTRFSLSFSPIAFEYLTLLWGRLVPGVMKPRMWICIESFIKFYIPNSKLSILVGSFADFLRMWSMLSWKPFTLRFVLMFIRTTDLFELVSILLWDQNTILLYSTTFFMNLMQSFSWSLLARCLFQRLSFFL